MHLPPLALRLGLRATRTLFLSPRLTLTSKRRIVDLIAGTARPAPGVAARRGVIAGVPVEDLTAPSAGNGTLLYVHGGGYSLGSAAGYRGFVSRLATSSRRSAVVIDYSLSPESPFPVALDEAVAVYRALVADPARGSIVIAGDSAGGGLAMALAMTIRDLGLPPPSALGLICPWLDLAADAAGTRRDRNDPLLSTALISQWVGAYVGDADPTHPSISPLHGNLADLPPIVLHSAGDDPLAADSEQLVATLGSTAATGHVDHRQWPNLWHCFHLQAGFLRAADEAIDHLGRALHRVTSR